MPGEIIHRFGFELCHFQAAVPESWRNQVSESTEQTDPFGQPPAATGNPPRQPDSCLRRRPATTSCRCQSSALGAAARKATLSGDDITSPDTLLWQF
jgi:hypothetical protein